MNHLRDVPFSYEGFARARQGHFVVVSGGDEDPTGGAPVVLMVQTLTSDPNGRHIWISSPTVLNGSHASLGTFLFQGMTFLPTHTQRTGMQVGRLAVFQFAPRRDAVGMLEHVHMHVTRIEYGSVRELPFDLDSRGDHFHRERVRLGRVHIDHRRPADAHDLEFLRRAEQRFPWPREDWGEPCPPPRPTQREIPTTRDTDAPPMHATTSMGVDP